MADATWEKMPCGCSGTRLDDASWRVEASAFLCGSMHTQGDIVGFTVDVTEDAAFRIPDDQFTDLVAEIRALSQTAEYRAAQEEAHSLLALTVDAEGHRQFTSRADFDKCLAFLARLSGDDQWAFLIGDDRG
jgi:hypothetical protein